MLRTLLRPEDDSGALGDRALPRECGGQGADRPTWLRVINCNARRARLPVAFATQTGRSRPEVERYAKKGGVKTKTISKLKIVLYI